MNYVILGLLAALSDIHFDIKGKCEPSANFNMAISQRLDGTHIQVSQRGENHSWIGVVETTSQDVPDGVSFIQLKIVNTNGVTDPVDFWKECQL